MINECERCSKSTTESLNVVDYVFKNSDGIFWSYDIVCQKCYDSRFEWGVTIFPEKCDNCKKNSCEIYIYCEGEQVKLFKIKSEKFNFLCKECAIKQDSINELTRK